MSIVPTLGGAWPSIRTVISKGPIIGSGKGSGEISEMKEALEPGKVMYGLYRVTDTVDDITTVKFVFITW